MGLGEVNFFGGWELSQGLLFRVIIIQTIIINLRTYCPKYGLMIVFIKQILLSLNV